MTEEIAWFCVRSRPKHEHVAGARLRESGFEVLLPRIRFKKTNSRGAVWVTEALFPNYLFARFNWSQSSRLVRHAAGVTTVVHFGRDVPTVPAEVIEGLRQQVGSDELHVIQPDLVPSDCVQVAGGVLHGLNAVVKQVMPAKERVKVLLHFLGQQTTVELDSAAVVKEGAVRKNLYNRVAADSGTPK